MMLRWEDRRSEAIGQLLKWLKAGKLKFKESIFEGFENMPHAFVELMKGNTTGKVIVKV